MVSLDQLVEDAKRDFSKASDPAALEDAKARYLGKSGLLTGVKHWPTRSYKRV